MRFDSESAVMLLLTHGTEEIEAITPWDLMLRAGIEVCACLPPGEAELSVRGRNGIELKATHVWSEASQRSFAAVVLPGGPAANRLKEVAPLTQALAEFHQGGGFIAAICAAPLILKSAGLLHGLSYTAHPSTRPDLPNALPSEVVDSGKRILTSRGAGTAYAFGLAIIRHLRGAETAEKVAAETLYRP